MRRRCLFLFLFSLTSLSARAEVTVAFLEKRDAQGQLIQLENHASRFFHVAVWAGGTRRCWLHTDAYRGVVCDAQVPEKYGRIAEVLHHAREMINPLVLNATMGVRYDFAYDWSDHSRLYCSELVGKILRIPPQPMEFNPAAWSAGMAFLVGKPGLSPDKVFRYLRENRGYRQLDTRTGNWR